MMRVGTFNVRGLSGKVDLVQKLIESSKLDVIGLTETWARPSDSSCSRCHTKHCR